MIFTSQFGARLHNITDIHITIRCTFTLYYCYLHHHLVHVYTVCYIHHHLVHVYTVFLIFTSPFGARLHCISVIYITICCTLTRLILIFTSLHLVHVYSVLVILTLPFGACLHCITNIISHYLVHVYTVLLILPHSIWCTFTLYY